jgi:hypothetical protein
MGQVSNRVSPRVIPSKIQGEIWIQTLFDFQVFSDIHPTLV